MRQEPVQDHKRPARCFERDRLDIGPGRFVQHARDQPVALAQETLAQRAEMGARQGDQASVVPVGIVKGDPKTVTVEGRVCR